MQNFSDKYHFKNQIGKLVSDLGIKHDVYEKVFANIFIELFEKEKKCPCLFNYYKVSISKQLILELNNIKKINKKNFLIFFEDCQKLNNELNELVIKINIICKCTDKNCDATGHTKIDLSRFPLFNAIVENGELKVFKPELITSSLFLELFQQNINKAGLYFLFNLDKELLFIGKSVNLGETFLNTIYDRNIDGYISLAYTKSRSDIHVYEPYYIINEKPLLNYSLLENDNLSVNLEPLEVTPLVKIYENN